MMGKRAGTIKRRCGWCDDDFYYEGKIFHFSKYYVGTDLETAQFLNYASANCQQFSNWRNVALYSNKYHYLLSQF